MKCIHCGTDSKYRERVATGGLCARCKHRFAFEPAGTRDRVTDGQFLAAIQRVSEQGQVSFTERQLWYEFNRKWMRPGFWRSPYGWMAAASVVAAIFTINDESLRPLVVLVAGLGGAILLNRRANRRNPRPSREPRVWFPGFQKSYLARWIEVHGHVRRLLPPREEAAAAAPREVAPDVSAFSFDRALVTDRWETAAMLVANRFHFEHNCAVLSADGFPDGIAETVKTMLRRNPQLTVFALHDASPEGCLLPATLRGEEWFPDPSVRVIDLGLRPETARRMNLPVHRGEARKLRGTLDDLLPAGEVKWLGDGKTAELAALRPAQLMRAAYHGIAQVAQNPAAYDSSGPGGVGFIWIGDFGHHSGGDTAATDGFG